MKIFIGSKNKDKIKEIKEILKGYEILSLKEFPDAPDVIEDKDTITGNAVKKAIENAQFRKPVVPGDTLTFYVEKIQSRGNVWKMKGEAKVDGKRVANTVFTAMIVDKEDGE